MLEVELHKRFAGFQLEVSFHTEADLVVLFGPSGAGKSLTLQTIAGIVQPDTGYIGLDGQPLYDSARRLHLPPQRRRVGYVPQNYALFPHLSVAGNISFGLTGWARQLRRQRVMELLTLFNLEGLAHRRAHQLSGGQQQRVALARALAIQPRLFLLDEPFGALDVALRDTLRQELTQMQTRLGLTMLLVTHDLADVFAFGQHVIVYDNGRIIQHGPRDTIFFQPANRQVAELVRTQNILPAVVEGADCNTLWLRWQGRRIAASPQPLAPGTPVDLCIRPTQVLIVRPSRLQTRPRDTLLWGCIVRERMQAESFTLYVQLDHSHAAYDLEIVLPAYVYHRLGLATDKRILVELQRHVLHLMPHSGTANRGGQM